MPHRQKAKLCDTYSNPLKVLFEAVTVRVERAPVSAEGRRLATLYT